MNNFHYAKVFYETQEEFPGFQILRKEESALMKIIDIVLKVITLGSMRTFMTSFVTTIGVVVFVPKGWDDREDESRAATLRHERVHMRQRRAMGGFLFVLRYLWWPLPLVFAIGRRNIEQEAYAESLRAWVEYRGTSILDDHNYREHILSHFSGSNYFWTWPWRTSLERWYDGVVEDLRAEQAPL